MKVRKLCVAAAIAAVSFGLVAPTASASHSKDDCKNGGWQSLKFRNQGQCVKAANLGHGGEGGGGVG